MSIRDEITSRVEEGRLFYLPPLIQSQPVVRSMFIGEALVDAVTPPWEESSEGFRLSRLRADLDAFTEGRLISIAATPFKKPSSAYIARVYPPEDEVWDIRSRDPKPAIRVLGCFAETDVFVALIWEYRKPLGGSGSKEWRDFVERCKAAWRNLFPAYGPYKGDDLRDYVSANFVAV
jgi:hypothetical protein